VHILELPKFTNAAEELTNPLEAWLYFLRHAANLDSEQLPATLQAPEIQRAMGELTMLTQSELERERYEAREKHQRDERSRLRAAREAEEAALREGLEQGRAEGELDLIHFCQQLLGKPLTPREELLALAAEQRASLVTALQQELLAKQQTGNNP
jgi:predicted transposase/invertase (TIGR01784 family)